MVARLKAPRPGKRVILESPYAGDVERNTLYARAAMRDCLLRGEAPYASHLLYTQPGVLRDDVPEERAHGIDAGFAWRDVAQATVFYVDLGWSRGMLLGKDHATARTLGGAHTIEIRTLGPGWEDLAKEEEST